LCFCWCVFYGVGWDLVQMGVVCYEVGFVSEVGCPEAVRGHGLVRVDSCVVWVLDCEVSYQVVGYAVSWCAVVGGDGVCTVLGLCCSFDSR
jgi:hypothetical protein